MSSLLLYAQLSHITSKIFLLLIVQINVILILLHLYLHVSVLKTQSEHPSVSHRGGEDHHAAGDARQGQHFCSQGRDKGY